MRVLRIGALTVVGLAMASTMVGLMVNQPSREPSKVAPPSTPGGGGGLSQPGGLFPSDPDGGAVYKLLDTLHEAASKGDGEKYWSLFAPDAIFLGTDATERWTLEQFKAYAKPHFDKKTGWTYKKKDRHIFLGEAQGVMTARERMAWFDESLTNEKMGECRGTGVLRKTTGGKWQIVQYNLTVPIPNELVEEVAGRIKGKK